MTDTTKKAVERFADAQEGDSVWLYEPERTVRDAAGNYLGRGAYVLATVAGRTRSSIIINESRFRDLKFDIATGIERGSKMGLPRQIAGRIERVAEWWKARRYDLADRVRRSEDVETIKSVAHVLGFDEQPPEEIR